MRPDPDHEFPTLETFGAELKKAASEPVRRTKGIRWAVVTPALAGLALLALLGAFTGPGRAVADQIAELVGIGDDGTIDHAEDPRYPASGRGVVIAAGEIPEGPRYELVAFANRPSEDQREFVSGAEVATCISLDFPDLERRGEFNTTCFGVRREPLFISGSSEYDGGDGRLGPNARYFVTAETSNEIASVEASYVRADGERVPATVAYGLVDDDVLSRIGGDVSGGQAVIFIPDVRRPDSSGEAGYDSVVETVKVTAKNSAGEVISTSSLPSRRAEPAGGSEGSLGLEAVCADIRARRDSRSVPSYCDGVETTPEDRVAGYPCPEEILKNNPGARCYAIPPPKDSTEARP